MIGLASMLPPAIVDASVVSDAYSTTILCEPKGHRFPSAQIPFALREKRDPTRNRNTIDLQNAKGRKRPHFRKQRFTP